MRAAVSSNAGIRIARYGWAALLLGCAVPARSRAQEAAAPPLAERVRRDTEWISAAPSRAPGTPGHDKVQAQILDRIRALPGVRLWTQEIALLMPATERAVLTVAGGAQAGAHEIYPVWPSLVRLHTTPTNGISGRAVYVGHGANEDMPARSLRDQIAVMEMTGGTNWKRAFAFGASAVVLLGSSQETCGDAHAHLTDQPIRFPRYYLPDGPLADAFRAKAVTNIRVTCRGAWRPAKALNLYALVKPEAARQPEPALSVAAPYDSISAIDGLAPGADAAVDAALVLSLLEDFARRPPLRPVLFAFLDAQGINQLGVRHMLQAFSSTPEERVRIEWEDRRLVGEYENHGKLVAELGPGPDALERIHGARYKPLHRYVKDVLAEELNFLDREIPDLRLALRRAVAEDRPALLEKRDRLLARQNELRGLHNQILSRKPLAEANREESLRVWQDVRERVRRQIEEVHAPLRRYERLDRLRGEVLRELGLPAAETQPVSFVLGLDLSDGGVGCGPSLFCQHLRINENAERSATDFVRWLINVRDGGAAPIWDARLLGSVNLAPLRAEESAGTYLVGRVPTLTSPCRSFGVKGATWATLEGPRLRVDTACDVFARLDWSRLDPQIEATQKLVERMIGRDDFKVRREKPFRAWTRVWGAIVDRSPGDPVPRVPVPDSLTALVASDGRARHAGGRCTLGVRNSEFTTTGVDGRFRFEPMPTRMDGQLRNVRVESFRFDDDGRALRAVSRVRKVSGLRQGVSLAGDAEGIRAMMFDCVEVARPPVLFDVRKLQSLTEFTLLDAVRRAAPEYSSAELLDGQFCGFVPPKTRWQLMVRTGKGTPDTFLVNERQAGEGSPAGAGAEEGGFDPACPLPTLPERVAAQDMWSVDDRRLRSFRAAGIRSEVVDRIHERAGSLLKQAEEAAARDDGAGLYRAASAALANEMRAYKGVRKLADDIVRAAMILLVCLLPFSIAMERLLFASAHIYRQILWSSVIFAVMAAILWSFHPAFRITNQPLMLVLAFLVIFLSMMVVILLLQRFQSDLDKIRSGRAEASGASTSRGGLVACALTVGIATMRKRKLRTGLTAATVSLITFALLSFSSASNVKEYNRYELRSVPAYAGILIQQPNRKPLDGHALAHARTMVGTNGLVVPVYWWATTMHDQKWRIHTVAPRSGRDTMLKSGLVLANAAAELADADHLLPDWGRFQAERGCYLSPTAARSLDLKTGDPVLLGGFPFTFLGAFETSVFREKLKLLTGDPMLPLDYASLDPDEKTALDRLTLEQAAESDVSGSAATPAAELLNWMDPADLVVLPETNGVHGISLHAILARAPATANIEPMAEELAQRINCPVYYSLGEKTHVLASASLLPTAPRSLLIPLLVAGLMIFNTMLSSIAERRKEIHVYTSLGLAPAHVGGIFLAEACTYGMIGGVSGYIVGQGLATAFSRLGWLGGITLNYAGTQVMYTFLLVLGVVILSSLVPAILAGRLASPSRQTAWRLPEPEGDVLRDLLPFTVTRQAAPGVLMFLTEYLDAHRDGSIGHFTSGDIACHRPSCEIEPHAGRVEATLWLAPYDLGVHQHGQITVIPSADTDVCQIVLRLDRRSGRMKDWIKLNRTFVADLRRQLLGWRSVGVGRVLEYIRLGGASLGDPAFLRAALEGNLRTCPAVPGATDDAEHEDKPCR